MDLEKIEISSTIYLKPLSQQWLRLEQDGHCSPYQQYFWIKNFIESITPPYPQTHYFVTLNIDEEAVAILPFTLTRRMGCRTLTWLGNKHSNYLGGIYSQELVASLEKDSFERLWQEVKRILPHFDILWLTPQLGGTTDSQTPFAWLNMTPSANTSHQMLYPHHDWTQLLHVSRSKKTRKRMRNEENRLGREGTLCWRRLHSETDIKHYLPELLQQRETRFAERGITHQENLDEYTQLYQKMLVQSLDNEEQPTRMLILKLDDRLLAALILFKWKQAYYPLMISMTNSRYRSWSPGEYLLRIMMVEGCEEEIEFIDFGPGEDRYKTSWCNATTPLFDTVVAETLYGKLVTFSVCRYIELKRKIKHSPRLWALYCNVRKWRSKFSPSTQGSKQHSTQVKML